MLSRIDEAEICDETRALPCSVISMRRPQHSVPRIQDSASRASGRRTKPACAHPQYHTVLGVKANTGYGLSCNKRFRSGNRQTPIASLIRLVTAEAERTTNGSNQRP
jgi:hypothetical protein